MAHTIKRAAHEAKRGLTEWQRRVALDIAQAHPMEPVAQEQRYYRVTGDWHGGGFGYTLPFPSAADAEAWGRQKARFHADAVVTVVDRGPVPADAALAADIERDFDKGPKLAARHDADALAGQVLNADAMRRAGWIG